MSDVSVSEDGYGLVLDFGGVRQIEIGFPEANMLQSLIRQALVAAGCTMHNAVGYDDLKIIDADEMDARVRTQSLKKSMAMLLGVEPEEITRVDPTGYIVGVQTKMEHGGTTTFSQKVQLS